MTYIICTQQRWVTLKNDNTIHIMTVTIYNIKIENKILCTKCINSNHKVYWNTRCSDKVRRQWSCSRKLNAFIRTWGNGIGWRVFLQKATWNIVVVSAKYISKHRSVKMTSGAHGNSKNFYLIKISFSRCSRSHLSKFCLSCPVCWGISLSFSWCTETPLNM